MSNHPLTKLVNPSGTVTRVVPSTDPIDSYQIDRFGAMSIYKQVHTFVGQL